MTDFDSDKLWAKCDRCGEEITSKEDCIEEDEFKWCKKCYIMLLESGEI